MKTFGNIVQENRLKKDLSLRDLSNIAGLDFSYISRIEKGYKPSKEAVIKLSKALNLDESELLSIAGYSPRIDLLSVLEDEYAELTAAGLVLNHQQRLAIMRAIDNPNSFITTNKIPILGTIRAGIPLLSDQNIIGHIEIPADLVGKADFALNVRGDSMIGAGINNGDVAVCKENKEALPGQIVVALVNNDETTLKYYIRDNGNVFLRAANPEFKDIEFRHGDVIQGHVVKILKDPPPVNLYRDYIYFREGHLQEWNEVIEMAVASGIRPSAFKEFVDMQVEIAKRLARK